MTQQRRRRIRNLSRGVGRRKAQVASVKQDTAKAQRLLKEANDFLRNDAYKALGEALDRIYEAERITNIGALEPIFHEVGRAQGLVKKAAPKVFKIAMTLR